jgi:hypothetical protein
MEGSRSMGDMLGDCVLAIIQEFFFWIDVFKTVMQWDEESVKRDAEERLKQFEKFETLGVGDVKKKD